VIRPLFGWLRGRAVGERASADFTVKDRTHAAASARQHEEGPSGRAAGRREVAAIEALRYTTFVDREQAALHTQLARAPRDVGALFGLLAWHARRGERAEVASFAHALWDETDAEGELWRRAAALGRSVDADNPLYDEDPFAALAAHAALQPVTASLALDTLDLSLHAANAGDADDADLPTKRSGCDTTDALVAPPAQLANKPFFDIFSVPTGQLPASVLNLDMDLDTPSGGAPAWLAGLPPSTSLTAPSTIGTAPVSGTPSSNIASPAEAAFSAAERPAWVLARPRRARGRAGGKTGHRPKK